MRDLKYEFYSPAHIVLLRKTLPSKCVLIYTFECEFFHQPTYKTSQILSLNFKSALFK